MEGFQSATPFARLVAQTLKTEHFTLLDIGCSSGIDAVWRAFGERLRALAFDPNINEIARLAESETLPGVEYVAAFIGVPSDDPGAGRMRTGDFWGRMPWSRLSVARTMQIQAAANERLSSEEKTKLNMWDHVALANPEAPIILPTFLRERGVNDVDFVKIDVDGADFLILRSLVPLLADANVLGVGIEVNFHGTDDPDVHTLHNVDRLMKKEGFELFSLSSRPYSTAALPAPYQLSIPAQTHWGRILQGDALYLRDAAAPDQRQWAEAAGAAKLLKLAAIFSLAGLPDCSAEILLQYRETIAAFTDVTAGLDALTAQCVPEGEGPVSYAQYMSEFEADGIRFWPKRREQAEQSVQPSMGAQSASQADSGSLNDTNISSTPDTRELAKLRSELAALKAASAPARAIEELTRLNDELAELKSSPSWRLTAPLRALASSFKHPASRQG
jgi:FkbM family methyltransferase